MGVLRLMLAVAVVLEHCGPLFGLKLMGGPAAVQTFYMISGFYMALILQEKYIGHGSYSLFISNRLLRIFPAYWTVLALSLVFWLAIGATGGQAGPLQMFQLSLDPFAMGFLVLSNLLIFGQDWVLFLGLDPSGNLFFTSNYMNQEPRVYQFLLIPPAWSLGLELTFYLVAPLLVRRSTPTLLALLGASLALRLGLSLGLDFSRDPWTYRFFPTELAFFLIGAVGYRGYCRLNSRQIPALPLKLAGSGFLLLAAVYQFLPEWQVSGLLAKQWVFYALAAGMIPVLFTWCKRSQVDRYIGELSYPVYISHILVLTALSPVLRRLGLSGWLPLFTVLGSLLVSIALTQFVMNPIERLRQRRVHPEKQPPLPVPTLAMHGDSTRPLPDAERRHRPAA